MLFRSVKAPKAPAVKFAAFIPDYELKTQKARGALPKMVAHKDAAYNLSRAALMTASLFSGKLENLKIAAQDKLHQPYRLRMIPGGKEAMAVSYELGAYASYISGAGPTIMSMIDPDDLDFRGKALAALKKRGIQNVDVRIFQLDTQGATVTA